MQLERLPMVMSGLDWVARHAEGRIKATARELCSAAGILEAYHRSPNGSLAGLAREVLGLEDQQIEMGKIIVAMNYLQTRLGGRRPEVMITLGSGLGDLANQIEDPIVIPYADIPCFPHPTDHVAGHAGNLVVGMLGGKMVAAMQGRFHLYQGVTAREAVRPARVLACLGASYFIVSNAAGGIKKGFNVGDIMLISGDLNFTGQNPLVGPNLDDLGPRFPDMSAVYSREMRETAREVASELGRHLQEGIYAANMGPNYERPEEIAMLQSLGAHAVGMSTAPEVLAINHMSAGRPAPRVKILGLTLITNLAAGLSEGPLDHAEVQAAADKAAQNFQALVRGIIARLD